MSGSDTATQRRRFRRSAGAGAAFQAGSAAVDSATVVASLVFHLTGSAFAVGAASAVLRLGWLLPQLVVGYLAERSPQRMRYYIIGAYGRALCAGLIAVLLWWGSDWPTLPLAVGFLALWTLYAFVSGIVAVPYNDIVGRSIPSGGRSRMLAWRFFGGGVFALAVAFFIRLSLDRLPTLTAYALIFALASLLMILSATLFVSAGEPALPQKPATEHQRTTRMAFLKGGWETLRDDTRFRLFLQSQWLGSATLMALPFYVVAARQVDVGIAEVGTLLGHRPPGRLCQMLFGAGSATEVASYGCCRRWLWCGCCHPLVF